MSQECPIPLDNKLKNLNDSQVKTFIQRLLNATQVMGGWELKLITTQMGPQVALFNPEGCQIAYFPKRAFDKIFDAKEQRDLRKQVLIQHIQAVQNHELSPEDAAEQLLQLTSQPGS